MSKLVYAKTEHSDVIKVLMDVLKDALNEMKIDFIRDPEDGDKYIPPTKQNKKKQKPESKSESESSEDEKPIKKKMDVKKFKKQESEKNKKKKQESESESESEDDHPKKRPKHIDDDKKKKSSSGIKIVALDDYQTLLIFVKLNADQFVEFYVKDEKYSIALDLIQFQKFTKTIDKDSIMTFYIDKDDKQNLVVELDNEMKKNCTQYKQKLLDIDDDKKELPKETKFEMSVIIDTADFRKVCSEMNQFSEYMEITCTNKEITFKCQGDSNAYIKTFRNSDNGVKIVCYNNVKDAPVIVQAIYDLKYLVIFGKCVNLCNEMQLHLKNDYPLFISYTIGNLGKMIVGLSPVDEKKINRDNNYDENNDKYYDEKKVVLKD